MYLYKKRNAIRVYMTLIFVFLSFFSCFALGWGREALFFVQSTACKRVWDWIQRYILIERNPLSEIPNQWYLPGQKELLPASALLYGEEILENPFGLWTDLLQKEVFPIQQYAMDYWSDNESMLLSYHDILPAYFKESDDSKKEEDKKRDPGVMETDGSGTTYLAKQLWDYDFLLKNFYIVDETTTMTKEDLDGKQLTQMDLSLNLAEAEADQPLVLIYHTHGSETYKKVKGKEGSVIDVGTALAKQLKDTYGISVLHDTTIYDQINGSLDRSAAYNYAGEAVERQLKEHPSIQVVIDLHRDSVEEKIHLKTKVKGKDSAQIMFFNGVSRLKSKGEIAYLANENKRENLAFSLQLQLLAAKYYPGLTRKIYIKGYRYNLHMAERSMLVEVGAQNNTVGEAKRSMEALAEILYRLLNGEKAYASEG